MEWVWLSLFQSQKLPAHTFASGVEVLEYIKYRYERLWYCTVVPTVLNRLILVPHVFD